MLPPGWTETLSTSLHEPKSGNLPTCRAAEHSECKHPKHPIPNDPQKREPARSPGEWRMSTTTTEA